MTGTITWSEKNGIGRLTLTWEDDTKSIIENWPDPITAKSDSHAIAGQFGYDADSHDGEYVFVSR